MAGNLQALALIAVIIGTTVILKRYGRRPARAWNVVIGVLLGVVLCVLGSLCSMHFCKAGTAIIQWLIPAVCLVLIFSYVQKHIAIRLCALVILYVAGIGLSYNYMTLVHQEGYTGNRIIALRSVQQCRKENPSSIRKLLARYPPPAKSYPAGWLRDSAILCNVPENKRSGKGFECIIAIRTHHVHFLWHSWLTGLYGTTPSVLEAWYPGGPPEQRMMKIEFRERGQ